MTALMLASGKGRTSVVKLLLARGASVDIVDNVRVIGAWTDKLILICVVIVCCECWLLFTQDAKSAIVYASEYQYINIALMLIEAGAEVSSFFHLLF